MLTYKGYSSFNFGKKGESMIVTDRELIKRDILNAIFTTKGTVPKNRSFGTIIPVLLFQPFSDSVVNELETDLRRVIKTEPRIQLVSLTTTPNRSEKSINVLITFLYVEDPDIVDQLDLSLNFEG